jgi:hypothetical protein
MIKKIRQSPIVDQQFRCVSQSTIGNHQSAIPGWSPYTIRIGAASARIEARAASTTNSLM